MCFVGFLKVQVFGNKQNEQSEEGGGDFAGNQIQPIIWGVVRLMEERVL